MKLEKFNELLGNLAAEPNQQNLLNVAYGLMEWMGIEHTEKPKILTPKTDKLRKYLQTRKELSRPDLRVISTPDQPIEVRIGMLHNIGKNQLYYLVDRDTRIDAWQNEPGPIQKRSKTPYIFHFATDHKYDRLLFILHQNGQKRIMILRDRLSQTQYNKILQAIENVGKLESKYEIQERLWNCLDLKEVNKSFYKEVKTKYDALVEILRSKYTVQGNQESQFAVRLIGRYIFCWFLKEKGIIDQNIIGSKTIRETPDYYESLLKKLFFSTLNAQVGLRQTEEGLPAEMQAQLKRIPYLNGGLFDETPEDHFFTQLELNDWLNGFVQVLEQYDFTVDESSPSYQQIAIDPEMLGRIFENLLASINPETEKLANERKAFGAFYTPREIVEYMVNQSLRCYLETHLLPDDEKKEDDDHYPTLIAKEPAAQLDIFRPTAVQTVMEVESEKKKSGEEIAREKEMERRRKELKEKLDKFFEEGADNPFNKDETAQVRQLLDNCKVLDPACGSGAFPMGVLYKLEQLHETLGVAEGEDELRLRILSNNIFGVDIMPMAVDISRLRAWLSIVLVADYKPNQPKNNFNVHPLPNLDFKFVCANTLIDVPEDEYVRQLAHNDLERFDQLTREYFGAKFQQKDELKAQIQECLNAITETHEIAIRQIMDSSMKHEKSDKKKSKDLEKLKERYSKDQQRWRSYTHIFENKPVEFFKTRYFFPSAEKGFDVVIGNPPYLQIQKLDSNYKAALLEQDFLTFEATGDLYQLFYEKAILLLKLRGLISFITSNKWMRSNYGESTRKFLALETRPRIVIDFGMTQVFESATTYTNIIIALKSSPSADITFCRFDDNYSNNHTLKNFIESHSIKIPNPVASAWVAYSTKEYPIIRKVESSGIPLKDWAIKINRGILTGYNEAFVINDETKNRLIAEDSKSDEIIHPLLRGEDVKAYTPSFQGLWLIGTFPSISIDINHYKSIHKYLSSFKKHLVPKPKNFSGNWKGRKAGSYEWYETQDSISYFADFSKPKIIFPNMTKFLPFVYDEDGFFTNQKCYIITGEHLKYLTAVLNSKLWKFAFKNRFPELLGDTYELSKVFFEKIPIKIPDFKTDSVFAHFVDIIIEDKMKSMTTETYTIERQIDMMVYHLYGLTLEEARVVDASVGEEEFEAGREMLG